MSSAPAPAPAYSPPDLSQQGIEDTAKNHGNCEYAAEIVNGKARVLGSILKLAKKINNPCLEIAAKKLKEKFERGNLAQVYGHVDSPGSNHAQVITTLEGGAFVWTDPEYRKAPACCGRDGIFFNKELLDASKLIVDILNLNTEHDILNNAYGAAYVALLELAIAHEIGHIKLHQEVEVPPKLKWAETVDLEKLRDQSQLATDDNFPLHTEAGFSIEARIRHKYFNERIVGDPKFESYDSNFDPPLSMKEKLRSASASARKRITLIDVYPSVHGFGQLQLQLRYYEPTRQLPLGEVAHPKRPLTLQEIQEYMNFGYADADGGSGNGGDSGNSGDSGDSGNSGDSGDSGNGGDSGDSGNGGDSGDSGNGGDSGDSGNGGDSRDSGNGGDDGSGHQGRKRGRKNDSSGTPSRPTKRTRSRSKKSTKGKTNRWAQGSRERFPEPKKIIPPPDYPPDYNPNCSKVSIRIVDRDGIEKGEFLPTEDIFVEVTAKNRSKKPQHIRMNKGPFAFGSRGGHRMVVENQKGFYTPSESLSFYKTFAIDPGEEQTFKTIFLPSLLNEARERCRVYMPEKAGNYEAGFYSEHARYPENLASASFAIKDFDTSLLTRCPGSLIYRYREDEAKKKEEEEAAVEAKVG